MTYFIKLENNEPVGFPVVEENIRILFPTLVKSLILPEDIEPLGFGIYDFSSQPECGRYEKCIEVTPVRNEQGIFIQTWDVVQMSAEEQSLADEKKSQEVRFMRNRKLFACDWTQLSDSPVDGNLWRTYRQQLRDVPNQEGFPWDVIWPVSPNA